MADLALRPQEEKSMMYGLERILRLSRCRRRLMVLLKWLSDLPFVRLRLKGEREDAFREMLEKDSRLIDELHGEVLQLKERFYAQEACLEKLVLCLCTTVALLAGSCRSINESTTIHRLDSLVWDRKVSATPEIIPPARAALSVPLDSSVSCPAGQPIQREADRRPSASPSERVT